MRVYELFNGTQERERVLYGGKFFFLNLRGTDTMFLSLSTQLLSDPPSATVNWLKCIIQSMHCVSLLATSRNKPNRYRFPLRVCLVFHFITPLRLFYAIFRIFRIPLLSYNDLLICFFAHHSWAMIQPYALVCFGEFMYTFY